MFKIFTKKNFIVSAPISGRLIDLTEIEDEVFASKMMGDGFAVRPINGNNLVIAPVEGKIVSVSTTRHAVGIETTDGIEVLVHVGIDTVRLQGKGFKLYVAESQKVKRGDKLIEFDEKIMSEEKLDMAILTIFVKGYDKKVILDKQYGQEVASNEVLIL